MNHERPVGWGVIGTGRIAEAFVDALPSSQRGRLAAVGSRTPARARSLAERDGHGVVAGSYENVLMSSDVDAVYIATPHPSHADLCVAAAAAGKHILCEKPLAMTRGEAARAVGAARQAGVFLMESFKYRCQPQMATLKQLIADGEIGAPLQLEAACAFRASYDRSDRLFDPSLGGGAILDVGCYPVSLVRLVVGSWVGDDGVEPDWIEVGGYGQIAGVDEWAVATLGFAGGAIAQVRTGTRLSADERLSVYGERGYLQLHRPWSASGHDAGARITVHVVREDAARELFVEAPPMFALQIDAATESFERGECAFMSHRDSLANMATLDRWRTALAT